MTTTTEDPKALRDNGSSLAGVFDLDIAVVTSTTVVMDQTWNSGRTCNSNDGCGHTCQSACANSCTDGE
ncbi:FxLD family lanthipeptide [Actinokineospora sp. NBRC 105648]|uniref:FxLD family lanthipeptide n=1 Tax=Actinokineospora sp. NBRC 105648 TaxID=3032206 RepID=UPI0024A0BB2C|nr:FxLD family lanthipeptide [Actinokineospora sp. NBRC 105648]GLZ42647.1 hypothetical protein Acsp05_62710 [Actinokineospora sp. NBRC 105648]